MSYDIAKRVDPTGQTTRRDAAAEGRVARVRDGSELPSGERLRRVVSGPGPQEGTDALAGLADRLKFLTVCREAQARIRREGGRFAVVVIKVDDLERVREELGRPAGDYLLRQVAITLLRTVRRSDTVARLGGDEFALLLVEADQRGALRVAGRIRSAISAQRVLFDGKLVHCAVSAGGVEMVRQEEEDIESMIARAHQELDRTKRGGRDRVVGWPARGGEDGSQPDLVTGSVDVPHSLPKVAALV